MIHATSELTWLRSVYVLSMVLFLVFWLKGERCEDPEKDGATGRKRPGLPKAEWKDTRPDNLYWTLICMRNQFFFFFVACP